MHDNGNDDCDSDDGDDDDDGLRARTLVQSRSVPFETFKRSVVSALREQQQQQQLTHNSTHTHSHTQNNQIHDGLITHSPVVRCFCFSRFVLFDILY